MVVYDDVLYSKMKGFFENFEIENLYSLSLSLSILFSILSLHALSANFYDVYNPSELLKARKVYNPTKNFTFLTSSDTITGNLKS